MANTKVVLVDGQVWRMAELNLQVGMVGKLLVHYKLAKPDAVRVPNLVGSIATIQKFLKKNKAVLDATAAPIIGNKKKAAALKISANGRKAAPEKAGK